MSYEPTTWKSGDTVTSAKLNKLEQGVANAGGGGGVLVVNITWGEESGVMDKTWQEIHDAAVSGTPIVVMAQEDEDNVTYYVFSNVNPSPFGTYTVVILDVELQRSIFSASSKSGYPTIAYS